jgi:hypothetical protein
VKTTQNSVPWNKNWSKHLKFCSEPFRGRENNSKFRPKIEVNSQNSVPKHVSAETIETNSDDNAAMNELCAPLQLFQSLIKVFAIASVIVCCTVYRCREDKQ